MAESVTGRLMKRGNIWYSVLSYKDSAGIQKQKWISTGLPVKGNKLKAEDILQEKIIEYQSTLAQEVAKEEKQSRGVILFTEYLLKWLETKKHTLKENTYADYERRIAVSIIPFFKNRDVYIDELTKRDIEDFYKYLREVRKVTPATINRHHTLIHQALDKAVKEELVLTNVSDKIERDHEVAPPVPYYTINQLNKLTSVVKDTPMEIFVLFGIIYGLRRSEILGLRWKSIDFDNNFFMINHTVTLAKYRSGKVLVKEDVCKTKKSTRALPLDPGMKEYLLKLKDEQKYQRRLCGNAYYLGDSDYVCVDKMGHLPDPDLVTNRFERLLRNNHLPHIKFHALRHSCASAMIAKGVSLKIIQEYLGHSDYRTTDKFYGHLEIGSKILAMEALSQDIKIV